MGIIIDNFLKPNQTTLSAKVLTHSQKHSIYLAHGGRALGWLIPWSPITFPHSHQPQKVRCSLCSIIKIRTKISMTKTMVQTSTHHYSTIPLETRMRLVDLVICGRSSIGKAARSLRVKPSTAKMIVKRYKTRGDFFESKRQRAQRLNGEHKENYSTEHNIPITTYCGSPLMQPQDFAAISSPYSQPLVYLPVAVNEIHYWPWGVAEVGNFCQGFSVTGQEGVFGLHLGG